MSQIFTQLRSSFQDFYDHLPPLENPLALLRDGITVISNKDREYAVMGLRVVKATAVAGIAVIVISALTHLAALSALSILGSLFAITILHDIYAVSRNIEHLLGGNENSSFTEILEGVSNFILSQLSNQQYISCLTKDTMIIGPLFKDLLIKSL